MTEQTVGYIDIRLHVTFETETYESFGKEYSQRYMVEASPEVIGFHGMEEHELQDIGHSLTQMDPHQLMLANDIPNEIYNYAKEDQ